jgi:CDP-diacylglycerol--glycerol-3-phosphate 3-phosphatidyltransferase
MLAHIAFAWLLAIGEFRWAGLAIFIVAPLDALDGALARKIGRTNGGFGAFLDSTLDRLAEAILFAGFIYYFTAQEEPWLVLASYAAVTGSLLVSYTRARAESLGLSAKIGILSRVERYGVIVLALLLNVPAYGIILLAVGTYLTAAQRMVHVWRQTR